MKPQAVLSNGERFRVDLARRLLELPDPIVVDEFTSVVDRQVAKIGAHAVQKFVRKHNRRFVAATCHYDVVEWLQPDWIFSLRTCRSLGGSFNDGRKSNARSGASPGATGEFSLRFTI
jgi:ABC-type ATPase with predicted acetyltransferase domain